MAYRIIDLSGSEGNAFALIAVARKWGNQLKDIDPKFEPENISKEMKKGDYNYLLDTFDSFFKDVVDYKFINDPRETND